MRYVVTVSTKHVRTTGDLVRFRAAVKIDCGHCGASRTLDGQGAVRLGGSCDLPVFEARLRCARCRAKAARLTILPPL